MIAFEAEAARPALNGPGGPTGDQKGTEAIDVQDRQLGPRWNELEQSGGQRNDQNRAADADARRQGQIPPGLSSQRSLGQELKDGPDHCGDQQSENQSLKAKRQFWNQHCGGERRTLSGWSPDSGGFIQATLCWYSDCIEFAKGFLSDLIDRINLHLVLVSVRDILSRRFAAEGSQARPVRPVHWRVWPEPQGFRCSCKARNVHPPARAVAEQRASLG